MAEHLADRTGLGPDHRHADDRPLPGTEDLTPLRDDPWADDWYDDCPDCGLVHRDDEPCPDVDPDDAELDLDALADLLEPPWVTLTPRPEYL